MVWTDITAALIAAGKRIPYTLFNLYARNDEAGLEAPFQVDFAAVTGTGVTHPTFTSTKYQMQVRVPKGAKTLRGTLELKTTAGTGYIRATLNATNADADPSTASTTYATVSLLWSDISSMRDTEQTLLFKLSNSGSGNTTSAQSIDRATFWWGYD